MPAEKAGPCAKVTAAAAAAASAEQDDGLVKWGDIVYFEHETQPGFLFADGFVDQRLGLIKPAHDNGVPQQIARCLFRVCPPLRYSAQKQLAKEQARVRSASTSKTWYPWCASSCDFQTM